MAQQLIKCIHCQGEHVLRNGTRKNGVQNLKCKDCSKYFQQEYASKGAVPETKALIVRMSVNGSGIRDISRVLGVSQNTVMSVLKKRRNISSI